MTAKVQLIDSGSATKALSDFVTLTDTQTLTNKTLTSPTINTPTIATPTITAADIVCAKLVLNDATAPVNAVAATRVLTVGGLPTAGHTVTIDGQAYAWVSALSVAEVKATGALTFAGLGVNTQTVEVEGKTYTWVTNLTGALSTSTLTITGNFTDGNRIVIGDITYTYRESLSDPAVPYEVKIGASASDTLDNTIAAITGGAGSGSTYSTGTVAHTLVTAAAGDGDTMVVNAKAIGTECNTLATLEYSGVASWTGATMGSGVAAVPNEVKIGVSAEACLDNLLKAFNGTLGEGTNYSPGTTHLETVTATKRDASHIDFEAIEAGTAGNAITTTETGTNTSFGDTHLTGGVDAVAEAAYTVLIGVSAEACIDNLVAAITKATGEGSTYGTGTVAHTTVTAAKASPSTMTATAKTKGEDANSIALTENDANTSWASATLTGGVNGTVGSAWECRVDSSYLYVAVSENTVSGANWRRVSIGTAY